MDKKELRKIYKAKRNSLEKSYIYSASKTIAEKLTADIQANKYDKALIFVSTGSEVDTACLIDRLLSLKDIEVAVPLTLSTPHDMEFITINSKDELRLGRYGIYEPNYNKEKICIPTENSVIYVPGLLYDIYGTRIGYGGGYYDKYLASHSYCSAIGICFDMQITDTLINKDENDICLDKIISDRRIINVKP